MKSRTRGAGLKPVFRAQLQSDGTLELLVYEEIGQNFWADGGGVSAKSFKDQLDFAGGNYDRLSVRINSPGGDASEGLAIFNLLRSLKKPVEVCVDGIAASAASIIAMAGDTITMGPNSLMMIHNAMGFCAGFASDMRAVAASLDKVSTAIGKTYSVRTGNDETEIAAMMEAETWLSAQECLDQNFCTGIADVGQIGEVESNALALARRFKLLAKLQNVPDALKARSGDDACECECGACADGNCDQCTNVECADPNCTDCPMQQEPGASASADLAGWRDRLGTPEPISVEDARARLAAIDGAGEGTASLAEARARVDAIEETLGGVERGLR
jgi:ATP-dependent Clp protease protease subunit